MRSLGTLENTQRALTSLAERTFLHLQDAILIVVVVGGKCLASLFDGQRKRERSGGTKVLCRHPSNTWCPLPIGY